MSTTLDTTAKNHQPVSRGQSSPLRITTHTHRSLLLQTQWNVSSGMDGGWWTWITTPHCLTEKFNCDLASFPVSWRSMSIKSHFNAHRKHTQSVLSSITSVAHRPSPRGIANWKANKQLIDLCATTPQWHWFYFWWWWRWIAEILSTLNRSAIGPGVGRASDTILYPLNAFPLERSTCKWKFRYHHRLWLLLLRPPSPSSLVITHPPSAHSHTPFTNHW